MTTVKSSPDLTMVVHLKSVGDRYDMLYLRNYAVLNVKDQLAKIEGVGNVQLFGSGDYAMRLWLNPQKIAELGLTSLIELGPGGVLSGLDQKPAEVNCCRTSRSPTAVHSRPSHAVRDVVPGS